MYRLFLIFILAVTMLTPANAAPQYIVGKQESLGGNAWEYLARIEKFRASKTRVVLPPECWSSCTLYSILLKDGLVCAPPGAKMVFHQFMRKEVRTVGSSGEVTSYYLNPPTRATLRRTWWAYPAVVRSFMPRGLPEWGKEITITARQLGIPNC